MKPSQLDNFMYALMKEVRRHSFWEFIENWDISKEEYREIEKWFKDQHDVKL
jgi:hypothetical protein